MKAWTSKEPTSANHWEETAEKDAEVVPRPGTIARQAMASTVPPPCTSTKRKMTLTVWGPGPGFRKVARKSKADPCPTVDEPIGLNFTPIASSPAWAERGTTVRDSNAPAATIAPIGLFRSVVTASGIQVPGGTWPLTLAERAMSVHRLQDKGEFTADGRRSTLLPL